MFNIDTAVSEWRARMLAAGVRNVTDLDELTEHLRSDVEEQLRSGADAEFAFASAVERIGAASKVREEFSKVRARPGARLESWFSAGLVMLLIATVLGCELVFSTLRMNMVQQVSAFAGLTLIFVVACRWRHALAYFPIVSSRQRRYAIGFSFVIAAGLGLLAAFWLPNSITNSIERAPDGAVNHLVLWSIWAGVPMTLCVCSALALLMDRDERQLWGMTTGHNFTRREQHV
jgi:hypothetical protein